jgi:hypothetical protein
MRLEINQNPIFIKLITIGPKITTNITGNIYKTKEISILEVLPALFSRQMKLFISQGNSQPL